MHKKLLIIQTAALGHAFLQKHSTDSIWCGLPIRSATSLFPALTCPVQGSIRTALSPSQHGMLMNGIYSRTLRKPMFWEQSSALVEGPRIWAPARERGYRVGMLFWQQSMGEDIDILMSPAPIHTHGGGMVQDVYSKPRELYKHICSSLKQKFKLSSYWGPLASIKSTQWISQATINLMQDEKHAPELLFTYLPHLDYALQKYGPDSDRALKALHDLESYMQQLITAAESQHYDVLIFGDYAITPVSKPVFPNRHLLETGLLKTRKVGRRLYPDLHASAAFAVVDHQIAHVYIRRKDDIPAVQAALQQLEGIEHIAARDDSVPGGINHPQAGELIITAQDGAWLAYPWWSESREAPDYASHIDIHNKPGYDPCELFFGRHPFAVSTDPSKVKGSHGRAGSGTETALLTNLEEYPDSIARIGSFIQDYLKAAYESSSK